MTGPKRPAASPPGLPRHDDPSIVLDPVADPGGAALGATGAEAAVELPWPVMLHRRVHGRAQASRRYPWWVLTALLAGLFALNFTFTVFVVALPTVARQLHTHVSVLTWVSTGPLLAFGLAAPLFGRVGDLFGHRRLYLWGLAGATVAAVLTATAPDAPVLVAARCLDGVQGAATGTASMALILAMFAPADRVKAMGWWSMVGAGGPVIGVTVGSPVIQYLGWRALFWGQLGLIALALVVVALVLPPREPADAGPEAEPGGNRDPAAEVVGAPDRRIDWLGSWSLSGSVIGLMLALSLGPVTGWRSPAVLVPGAVGLVALAVFVRRERRHPSPLIPVAYFRRRNFVLPMGTRAFGNFAYFGGFFLFPLLMEQVFHYSETQVGLVSVARPLVFSLSAPVAGYMAARVGERTSSAVGAAAIVVSMVLFALLGAGGSLLVVVLALVLSGLGMGVASPSTSATQANEVDPSELGVMSATQQLSAQVGEVAGIQVVVTVQETLARHRAGVSSRGTAHASALLGSFHTAFWVGAGVAVAGLVCSVFIRDFERVGDDGTAGARPASAGDASESRSI
ncbi:MAG: MFS transporter [Acidimicrobiales bacterium]